MKRNPAAASILLDTVLLDELADHGSRFARLLEQIKRSRPGTEKYSDLLAELWVEAEVLRAKAMTAKEVIDEAVPDEDD